MGFLIVDLSILAKKIKQKQKQKAKKKVRKRRFLFPRKSMLDS